MSSSKCKGLDATPFTTGTGQTPMPKMIYGTAWKQYKTARYVYLALKAGFRGIDTAAQPRHYKESLVGRAVKRAIRDGIVKRSDLFIQTKFTPIDSQDLLDLPYDPLAPLAEQVHSSIASSLRNFDCLDREKPYIDCLILHTPLDTFEDTLTVWKTLETYVPHTIRSLGISNTPLRYVKQLCESPEITVLPACVQNRFYVENCWEREMRAYLRGKKIPFQAFWVLSGNPRLREFPPLKTITTCAGTERPIALYALVLGLGGTAVLDGTKDEAHMKEDIEGLQAVEDWSRTEKGHAIWVQCLEQFKEFIGEFHHVDMGDVQYVEKNSESIAITR
ncbi:Aldo/keto reductase [Annulohypoxylon maeteangense]|uniref:Aldo/keto reductase n=1 Tax=Annulohypoxylon maeteangense TaxID=1927788 RepID=UPI0020072DAD|nr:Aldo/keto reductase [Annulohypoxylon maeteangense]KAI0882496.1 Aldo/keto reductase [Annulohypoxylon maeteangense]